MSINFVSLHLSTVGYKGMYICDTTKPVGEGVSLSYRDEIIKYSKFAYGASEIMFHPVKDWCREGIIVKNFKDFLKSSNVPFSSKFGILGKITVDINSRKIRIYIIFKDMISIK